MNEYGNLLDISNWLQQIHNRKTKPKKDDQTAEELPPLHPWFAKTMSKQNSYIFKCKTVTRKTNIRD